MKNNPIKTTSRLLFLLFFLFGGYSVNAQVPTTKAMPDTSKMTYNQISHLA